MITMTWAWIAGFYEGEGTVCASKNKSTYTLKTRISQKEIFVLAKIKEFLFQHNINSSIQTQKSCSVIDISAKGSELFFRQIYPFMQSEVKIKQMELAFSIVNSNRKINSYKFSHV